MTASLSVSDGPNLHWFRLAFRPGNPPKSTTRPRVEEPHEASTTCQDRIAAGALAALILSGCSGTSVHPSGSAASRSATSQGSWSTGTSSATRTAPPSTTPSAASVAGALAQLRPLTGSSLAPGSDPGVLPAPVIIAEEDNNRLVIVDPQGRTLWEFPRPGDLAAG
jgi:hypothetical protein